MMHDPGINITMSECVLPLPVNLMHYGQVLHEERLYTVGKIKIGL